MTTTLRFTPHGLRIGVKMRPEDAAKFLQQVVGRFELAPAVTEGTRMSFDRLRMIFVQGLFCYDIFTLVHDHVLLVIEQALRDRFIEYYQGTVTFVDQRNGEHPVTSDHYDAVHDAVSKNKKWLLVVGDGQKPMKFNGMLAGLRAWARWIRLLRGQRNRVIEHTLSNMRNHVGHPSSYQLLDPWMATRRLSDLAEIINQLWGFPTPGGHLYPAPIKREVVVIGWSANGDSFRTALAKGLPTTVDSEDQAWQYAIVRAVFRPAEGVADPGLEYFDSLFENTHFPSDLLWGPGSLADATAWWVANEPGADECHYLDRTFVVRQDGELLYLPMRPAVAAALPQSEQSGIWHVIRADFPNDAYHHVRTLLTGTGCANTDECRQCPAQTLSTGTFEDACAYAAELDVTDGSVPDFYTPWAYPRSRSIGE